MNDAYIDRSNTGLGEIPQWELSEIRNLMLGNPNKWEYIFHFFLRESRIVSKFLMSKYFYQIAEEVYAKGYEKTIFVDFLWSLRSMYLTLFHVLNNPPPKADLYHSVSTGYAGIAASLGKYMYGSGYLLTEHGIYSREREEDIIKSDWVQGYFKNLWIGYFKNICLCSYKYADKIVTLFEANSQIQQELGAPYQKTQIVPNGIPVDTYQNLPGNPSAPRGPKIGAVIRFSPIKDIKTMIQVFHIVKSAIPDTSFYLMGPTDEVPEYYEECLQLLNNLGTKDVHITGKINVREYLGWMDLIVLTSISEGQPLALMEAMSAGKPCVATNVGSCKELLEGRTGDSIGPAGLVAPVMNYERIAEQIILLLQDEQLRLRMGIAARKRIETFYSEEQFVRSYEMLYKDFEHVYCTPGGKVNQSARPSALEPIIHRTAEQPETPTKQTAKTKGKRRRLFHHEKERT